MAKPLLYCTSLSLCLVSSAAFADSTITIAKDAPDPAGYVCIVKTVGNGKASKAVKLCTPKEKRHEPSESGKKASK
jgi:hypothetical protein